MSGGHWDYEQFRIIDFLQRVSDDKEVNDRFPKLAMALYELAQRLDKILYDLDWDLSGDTLIKNDEAFEKEAIQKLKKACELYINENITKQ